MLDRFLGLIIVASAAACAAPSPAEDTATTRASIIGGETSGGEDDGVVLLYHAGADDETCTATMLAPNLLVTARHCVADDTGPNGEVVDWRAEDLRVYVGNEAFTTLVDDASKMDAVGRTIVSPASTVWYPDIAFVVLDRALATPIAAIRERGGATLGETLDVVGYGLDETGRRPRTRMERRNETVTTIGPGRSPHIAEPIQKGEIVFGEAACSGDSGGPAFSVATGALVAVASRVGNGTAVDEDAPAAFCIGTRADDIYTTLDPVTDVLARALAAAGATPVLESTARAADLASAKIEATPAKAPASDPLLAHDGCSVGPTRSDARVAWAAGLAIAAISRRRRRARAR